MEKQDLIKDLKSVRNLARGTQIAFYCASGLFGAGTGWLGYELYQYATSQAYSETDLGLGLGMVGVCALTSLLAATLGYIIGKDAKKASEVISKLEEKLEGE